MTKTRNTRMKSADGGACESASKKGTVTIVLIVILIITIIVVPIVLVSYILSSIGGMIPEMPDLSGLT